MRYLLLVTCFICVLSSVNAQRKIKTGDAEVDKNMMDINEKASRDIRAFNLDLKQSFHVSEKKIEYMKRQLKMTPSEMYFALEISNVSKKSLDEVLKIFKTKRRKGWGYVAQKAGISPGSSEFMQIKSKTAKKSKEQMIGKITTTQKEVGGSYIMNQGTKPLKKDKRRNKNSY